MNAPVSTPVVCHVTLDQLPQTVYVVLCDDGYSMDIDSVWRTEQEAEAQVDRLRRLFPPYTYSIQANALQGAR